MSTHCALSFPLRPEGKTGSTTRLKVNKRNATNISAKMAVFFLPLYFRKSASSSTAHNCRRSSGILVFLLKPLPPRKTRYFVNKIVLTYYEEKLFQWLRKTFEIRGWRLRIYKKFEITRTICSNSESSEQFLTCSWRFLISNKLEELYSMRIQKEFDPIVQ